MRFLLATANPVSLGAAEGWAVGTFSVTVDRPSVLLVVVSFVSVVLPRFRLRPRPFLMLPLAEALDLPSYTLVGGDVAECSSAGLDCAGSSLSDVSPLVISRGGSPGADSERLLDPVVAGSRGATGVEASLSGRPNWLRLRSPEPIVLTASSLSPMLAGAAGSTVGSTWTLSSDSGRCSLGVFLGFGPPEPGFVLEIVLESVLAAFWAAESTFEKKPAPGVDGADGFSGVGVSGGSVAFDSLLGPILSADPDRARRCVII